VNWNPARLLNAMNVAIWGCPADPVPAWQQRARRLARLALALFRDVAYGQLTLWAMSLVYTTLLSFVPLLALSFSVLKAFGVHNQVEPMLHRLLAPLGTIVVPGLGAKSICRQWLIRFRPKSSL
jgi:membrane protein